MVYVRWGRYEDLTLSITWAEHESGRTDKLYSTSCFWSVNYCICVIAVVFMTHPNASCHRECYSFVLCLN